MVNKNYVNHWTNLSFFILNFIILSFYILFLIKNFQPNITYNFYTIYYEQTFIYYK